MNYAEIYGDLHHEILKQEMKHKTEEQRLWTRIQDLQGAYFALACRIGSLMNENTKLRRKKWYQFIPFKP